MIILVVRKRRNLKMISSHPKNNQLEEKQKPLKLVIHYKKDIMNGDLDIPLKLWMLNRILKIFSFITIHMNQ